MELTRQLPNDYNRVFVEIMSKLNVPVTNTGIYRVKSQKDVIRAACLHINTVFPNTVVHVSNYE